MSVDHVTRLEWDHHGRCRYRVRKTKKCEGLPGLSGGCPGTYHDDYGSIKSCNQCHGRGVIEFYVYMRVPEFDAPRPSKGWIPDWVEQ